MPTVGAILLLVLMNVGLLVVFGMLMRGFVRAARPNLSTRITKGFAQAALDNYARRSTGD